MTTPDSFLKLTPGQPGDLLYADHGGEFPTSISCWRSRAVGLTEQGTHFGYVVSGTATVSAASGTFTISKGMYFSVPGGGQIRGDGLGIVVTRQHFDGLFTIGGPIERTGRLRYIDGCSDTLLIGPVVCGDACLNLLHIPPNTQQTRHTHPSLRAGVIVEGHGVCRTPDGSYPLEPGMMFVIPAEAQHSFHTTNSDLLVVAYHPDSDTGPTHDDHPMVNRTIVNGVPASSIPEIRT